MAAENRVERIRRLTDLLREYEGSRKNAEKMKLWEHTAGLPNVFTRWIPRKPASRIPFIADLDRELWAQVLELDLEEIYSDPLAYLEFELARRVFAFEKFQDDMPVIRSVTIWHGVGILQTLFGLEQEPAANGHEPWVGKHRILERREDVHRLEMPSFRRSGLMPKIHDFYRTIREQLDDDFDVVFPEWDFGSFGIALSLRGTEDLLIDMLEDPTSAHALMRLLYESKRRYTEDRAKYLGERIRPLYIANDDVSIPIITHDLYEEFVLPYEIEMSRLHGGMDYWHSCGRIDGILDLIKRIPALKMIHVSYANDFERSAEAIGNDQIIEYVLNPIDDVLRASHDQMRNKLHFIRDISRGLDYTVRADAFQRFSTVEEDLAKVNKWLSLCHEVFVG